MWLDTDVSEDLAVPNSMPSFPGHTKEIQEVNLFLLQQLSWGNQWEIFSC
jgi:hypothetical protein